MKFPLALRVFAIFNLLAALAMFIQAGVLLFRPIGDQSFLLLSCFCGAWFLLSSILWFFSSEKSFALLLLSGITALIMAGSLVNFVVNSIYLSADGDKLFFLVYGGGIFVYGMFLLAAAFISKPIKEWKSHVQSKAWDTPLAIGFMVSLFGCLGIAYYLTNVARNFIVIETASPTETSVNGGLIVDYSVMIEMDAIALKIEGDMTGAGFEARIYFSDSYNSLVEAEFPNSIQVTFEEFPIDNLRKGESLPTTSTNDRYLAASFPAQKARRIMIRPINCQIGQNASITSLHSVSIFDTNTYAGNFLTYAEENMDEPEYAEGYNDDGVSTVSDYFEVDKPDSAFVELDHTWAVRLHNQFINDLFAYDKLYHFNQATPTVTINGKGVGHYLFFRSILDLVPTSLNQIIADIDNEEVPTNYSLNSGVRMLTGVNLFSNYNDVGDKFKYVNPKAVEWVSKNIVLGAQDLIGDVEAGDVYNKVFRRMFWQMAAAHEYLNHDDYFNQEAETYKSAMEKPEFRGEMYLMERYRDVTEESMFFEQVNKNNPNAEHDYYFFNESVAIGFWLRRKIDGSEPALWQLVQDIMKEYDSTPFPVR